MTAPASDHESLATIAPTPATPAPILRLSDVAIGFGVEDDVIRHLHLGVAAGEFVTVLGPSGCGKSTVLNAACGLLRVRAGTVEVNGKPVDGVNTEVGYMTQGDTLLPWRTLADNVALPLRIRRLPRSEIRIRVEEMLGMLELGGAARRYPAQLSGGMKRRALLGRSMIYRPAMLLMDEPFAALDAQLRTQMHAELLRAVTAAGQTVLFVTHDVDEAVLLSDRVVVLGGEPAAPIADIAIPFGPGRDLTALRFDRQFLDLQREVHEALAVARARGRS